MDLEWTNNLEIKKEVGKLTLCDLTVTISLKYLRWPCIGVEKERQRTEQNTDHKNRSLNSQLVLNQVIRSIDLGKILLTNGPETTSYFCGKMRSNSDLILFSELI